ncbi:hypothetical protein [Rhodohalobacter barkolensis]|uniref:Uncharacterized protein n=1 Tax=Rhodohalobacter barkolensis TaxID=2053187 RepID=A0A2N0VJ81_9BACT|nr:hypothetical protein [Rhodohalobacter barkolensis]PKD44253.1 hypothetical protein CWD77_01950 [Rhodohalobacter barkolensis]
MTIKQAFDNKIFLTGFMLLVIGSGPLLVTLLAAKLGITADPNPNPVFLGMMAMFTFWPGLLLMGIGMYREKISCTENNRS